MSTTRQYGEEYGEDGDEHAFRNDCGTVSLNLAVAAPSNVQESSRHLYDRVMEEFKHRITRLRWLGSDSFSNSTDSPRWLPMRNIGRRMPLPIGRYKEALKSFYTLCPTTR